MKRTFGVLGVAAIAVLVGTGGALATLGGKNQPIVAKVEWPDKEGISHSFLGHEGAYDSCVPSSLFHLPARRTATC